MKQIYPEQPPRDPDLFLRTLRPAGFTPAILQQYLMQAGEDEYPARVSSIHRSGCELITPSGPAAAEYAAALAPLPVSGDWVLFRRRASDHYCVTAILPRLTLLERQHPGNKGSAQLLAANFDLLLPVFPADQPFRPAKLLRFCAAARQTGAEILILFSKADLNPDTGDWIRAAAAYLPDIPALAVSAVSGEGIPRLQERFSENTTAVLLGSSGCGKSTLTNLLCGARLQSTAEVRAGDRRGRHTTSDRTLLLLPQGGAVIDSPGIRELSLMLESDQVQSVFPEIEALSAACRFRDCSHTGEPGCAVSDAVACGELPELQYQQYLKLKAEADSLKVRTDPVMQKQLGKRWGKLRREANGQRRMKGNDQ